MKRVERYLLLATLIVTPIAASAQDSMPNAILRVTVQQKEDGRVDKGFHILELTCSGAECSLSTVSMNQCVELVPGKKAFYPKVQHSAT